MRVSATLTWPRLFAALGLFTLVSVAHADEGMWTFDHPPLDAVRQRYGVALTPDLLEHLRLSAVNFNASATFVSRHGLILTNHHVAMDCIGKLSSPARDIQHGGHVAHDRAEELRCPGASARVLMSIEDVSAAVARAAGSAANDVQRNALRKRAIANIESDCERAGRLKCEIVSLYGGALHHLYRYREWDDVRLVFAPEIGTAAYGGDADNFVYPRYALDVALLRVYEHGEPVTPEHFLKLAPRPVAEGDPVFVIGHPGHTDRLQTMAELEFARTIEFPMRIRAAEAERADLKAYGARSPEAARRAVEALFLVENRLKAMRGASAILADTEAMARKQADETALRATSRARDRGEQPWLDIAAAITRRVAHASEIQAVEYGRHTLFEEAGLLVEQAHERALPEDERLADYRDSALPALERRLKRDASIYKDLEIVRLTRVLRQALELLGPRHPFVQATLGSDTPDQAAERMIRGTRIDDAKQRAALLAGGLQAIRASDDPLIRVAAAVYPIRRALVRETEESIEMPIRKATASIARARFAIEGDKFSPDATRSLRIAFGKVAGYESHGITMPWKTTFGGLFARADAFDQVPPFALPDRVREARSRIDPRIPLDFVTTADIIGGNSGSPVVDRNGEWVGVIFDGNLEGLGGRYVYSDRAARAIAVDARAILHALERIYDAPALADELRGGRAPLAKAGP